MQATIQLKRGELRILLLISQSLLSFLECDLLFKQVGSWLILIECGGYLAEREFVVPSLTFCLCLLCRLLLVSHALPLITLTVDL